MLKVFSNAGSVGRGITVNVGAAVTRIPPFLFNTPGLNEKDFVPPNLRWLNFEEGCACKEIGQRAFMHSKFKELRFPEGLENIGNDAFWGGALLSVTLPSTLKQIGSGAFLFNILSEIVNNSSLEINAGDEKAFGSIAKRADVLIHKGESFLQREGDYLFLAPEGQPAKLIGYSGEDDAPCLPDSFRGEKYIFGDAVFKRNEYITAMRIPGWLRVIPPSFCEGCLRLQRLEIEDGITEISSYAFEACNSLTSVILPRTVTKLGVGAFNCVSLRRIALSPALESIGQWAFLSCKSLKEIYNPSQITIIKGSDDNGKISENAEMINSESPSVLRNGDFEFWVTEHSCNLVGYYGSSREIKLPSIEGKTYTVGKGIFSNMGKLASFDTGDSVSIIKEDAFAGTSFESFTLGASALRVERSGGFGLDTARLIYAAERAEDLSPDDAWFCNVKEMTVRKNVKRIPANIMSGAFPLERIIFEEGSECASIGERAFYLTSIEEITVPQRIKSIGNEAFLECPRLSRVYFNAENMQDLSRDSRVFSMEGYSSNLPPLIELTVGRTVRRIPAYLFYGFDYGTMKKSRQLSDIVFESGSECEYIGVGAFGFQSSFSELMLPDVLKTIDSDAFVKCDGIESLTLPVALEKIGTDAFSGCKAIGGEIIIPESVSEIGTEVFDGCTNLESLKLRARIEEIPPFFVGYCEGLRSVEIPEYVKIIGRGAFKDCKKLKELTLPGSLEKIETQAFFGSGIMRIMIGHSVTEIGEEAFVQSALKSARFEKPNGWKTEKALFSLKLNDPVSNAEKLKAEKSKRWHRK